MASINDPDWTSSEASDSILVRSASAFSRRIRSAGEIPMDATASTRRPISASISAMRALISLALELASRRRSAMISLTVSCNSAIASGLRRSSRTLLEPGRGVAGHGCLHADLLAAILELHQQGPLGVVEHVAELLAAEGTQDLLHLADGLVAGRGVLIREGHALDSARVN